MRGDGRYAFGLGRPVTLVVGDVSFLHDSNGLNLLRSGAAPACASSYKALCPPCLPQAICGMLLGHAGIWLHKSVFQHAPAPARKWPKGNMLPTHEAAAPASNNPGRVHSACLGAHGGRDQAQRVRASPLMFCAGEAHPPVTVVLINNAGGGIFSMLPGTEAIPQAAFTQLWATPPNADLACMSLAPSLHVCFRSRGCQC